MMILFDGGYPLRVDWMDVEVGKINFIVFLDDGPNFTTLRVELIHGLRYKIREDETSTLQVACD